MSNPETTDQRQRTQKLWLWKNGDHFLAFDNPYPTHDGGDPMTLGEPIGYAWFTPSVPASEPRDAQSE